MADSVPAIRVTDPQSKDSTPDSPPTPPRINKGDGSWDGDFRRPAPPASRSGAFRDAAGKSLTSSVAVAASSKLFRPMTSNAAVHSHQANGQTTHNGDVTASSDSRAAIDPLSQHIMTRTHTSTGTFEDGPMSHDRLSAERATSITSLAGVAQRTEDSPGAHKEKKKGVSFLSRMIGKQKKGQSEQLLSDAGSDLGDDRPEGAEAECFTQPVDNLEFTPTHPQPPAYIKVRARNKKVSEFDRLFLAQELRSGPKRGSSADQASGHHHHHHHHRRASPSTEPDTVWAMKWSKDGEYLAAAGHDKVVRVWAVISSAEERQQEENKSAAGPGGSSLRLSAPVFQDKPIREYQGHSSTILDLSWSKNNFLLSSSMDKTVRLWHISRAECLCTFKHNDFVTSIAFHPKDDRFFVAGSLDCKLRLWSIPDKTVAYWAQVQDMITAVAFVPDGKHVIAGCLSGLCTFYETEGMKYQTQIHVRSAHGKNAKGSKITGIQALHYPPPMGNGDVKLLITSNDSRVRFYNFRDKSLELKFKGVQNNCSQIRASITDDARYIACGSEDHKAYVWSLEDMDLEKRDQHPMEIFDASTTITTCVSFAPAKTRQLLGRSEDPIYDLCNPPPVTLFSHAERTQSRSSSRPPSDFAGSAPSEGPARTKRPEESPAYTARSTHKNGNIIVTADFAGQIKVFRQDCAWSKRRSDISRRKTSGVRRSTSIATKASNRSLNSNKGLASASQQPSDRILSWRQSISSTTSLTNGARGNRSPSPRKSHGGLSSNSRREPALRSAATTTESLPSTDPTSAAQSARASPKKGTASKAGAASEEICAGTDDNPLMLGAGDQSNMFWDINVRKDQAKRAHELAEQHERERQEQTRAGGPQRAGSYVSQLSMDRSSGGESEYEEAQQDTR